MNADDAALIAALQAHGAGHTTHLRSNLLRHLQGTQALLRAWGARPALCRAGLFHAVRGTQHFDGDLAFDPAELEALIGSEAVSIIQTYVDADREVVWPQFGQPTLRYRNRRDGSERTLDPAATQDFHLLTLANELEILARDRRFRIAHGALFRRTLLPLLPPLIPASARADCLRILGERERWLYRGFRWLYRVRARLSPRRWWPQKR
jgi:hypothetical protein